MNKYKVIPFSFWKRSFIVKGDSLKAYSEDTTITIYLGLNSDKNAVFIGCASKVMVVKQ